MNPTSKNSDSASLQNATETPSGIYLELVKQPKDDIEKFCSFVRLGLDSWEEAGRKLVEMTNKDNMVFGKILARASWLSESVLQMFYRIGLKQLHPAALLVNNQKVMRLLCMMPYEHQKAAFEKQVKVFIGEKETGEKCSVVMHVNQLSAAEARQVFSEDGIIPIEKQTCNRKPIRIQSKSEHQKTHLLKTQILNQPVVSAGRVIGRWAVRIDRGNVVIEKTTANPPHKISMKLDESFITVLEFYTIKK